MYSLQYHRFLIVQQGFLRVTSRKQVCQHITDFVFYVLVVISESPECLCFGNVRSNDYACRLSNYSCDRHLWIYRPFTSFYHVTSTEPRQNRKPCGQLSSLASETHHRTAFQNLRIYFRDLHKLNIKLYRLHNERNLTGVLGLNMFYGFTFDKANLWWFWDQITIKPRTSENCRYHRNELAVRSVFSTITHERLIWIGSSLRPTGLECTERAVGFFAFPRGALRNTVFSRSW